MSWTIKRLLGFREFVDLQKVLSYVKEMLPDSDLKNSKHILLEHTDKVKAWIVSSNKEVFIIRDDGFGNLKSIFRRNKKDVKFELRKDENNRLRLYISDTITSLPINIATTGGTETFKTTFDQMLNE